MESVTSISSICTASGPNVSISDNTTGSSSNIDSVVISPCGSSIVSDCTAVSADDENTGGKCDAPVRNLAAPTSNTRALRWCSEISTRARLVPDKNVDSFDFDKEVRELRGLYKHCGSTVGPFRPLKTAANELSMDSGAQKSNEW
jgi:hypothetical protein